MLDDFGMPMEEAKGGITGTNCYNCKFSGAKHESEIKEDALDPQGGFKLHDDEIDRAKAADLVTLPGEPEKNPTARPCNNPALKLNITRRQCCALWDNDGAYRGF